MKTKYLSINNDVENEDYINQLYEEYLNSINVHELI